MVRVAISQHHFAEENMIFDITSYLNNIYYCAHFERMYYTYVIIQEKKCNDMQEWQKNELPEATNLS